MTWQIISVLLNVVIVAMFAKLMWDHRKQRPMETLNLDQMSRVAPIKRGPFSKPTGKTTPKINDDEAAYRIENKLDLKDEKH